MYQRLSLFPFVLFSQNTNLFFHDLIGTSYLYTVIIFAFMKPFEKMNRDTMEANAVLSSSIIEDINGIETIKSLTSESQRYQKLIRRICGLSEETFTYSRAESRKRSVSGCPSLAQCRYFSGWGCSGHGWQDEFGAVDYL